MLYLLEKTDIDHASLCQNPFVVISQHFKLDSQGIQEPNPYLSSLLVGYTEVNTHTQSVLKVIGLSTP